MKGCLLSRDLNEMRESTWVRSALGSGPEVRNVAGAR